ncbi:MAG: hypothetical protein JWO13_2248 [Acidobacteriales bacterium]|nr:hypothetical protein [Terriglobales bacterium]
MAKQIGACAFTRACTAPGPRTRLEHTNLHFCPTHLKVMSTTASFEANGTEFARTEFIEPRQERRRRSSWLRETVGIENF